VSCRRVVRQVGQHHLAADAAPPWRAAPGRRVLADRALQHAHLHQVVGLGHTDALAEPRASPRREAAPPQPGDGRHARIVPAAHDALLHQLRQQPLAHHRVFEIEPAELDLARLAGHRDVLDAPVVQRPMILELQRAQRMGDALERVGDRMRVVVGGIQAPLAAGLVMDHAVADAVEHRVAQVDVRRGHVDLRPQRAGAVRELAGTHARNRSRFSSTAAIAIGAVAAGLGEGAAIGARLLGAEVADIGQALLDQFDGEAIELLEIIRGEERRPSQS
jgi:hypothetical protein